MSAKMSAAMSAKMSVTPFQIIIPARYASSRLPGKPLLKIGDKPMIQHVIERCLQSSAQRVVVATDHLRIFEFVESLAANMSVEAVMTDTHHCSGSDRIAQATTLLDMDDSEIVVNVQGDEPSLPAALINQVAQGLIMDTQAMLATASCPIQDSSQMADPNEVKVVIDRHAHALYFSRAPIPWVRDQSSASHSGHAQSPIRRHLGIYAYRAGYIRKFAARPPCELETLEKLEQLRALWYGDKICMVDAIEIPDSGIDTAEDLERARARLSNH